MFKQNVWYYTKQFAYLVKDGLVECGVLPLQLVDFLVELCLCVGTLELESLEGINPSLHILGQKAEIQNSGKPSEEPMSSIKTVKWTKFSNR